MYILLAEAILCKSIGRIICRFTDKDLRFKRFRTSTIKLQGSRALTILKVSTKIINIYNFIKIDKIRIYLNKKFHLLLII